MLTNPIVPSSMPLSGQIAISTTDVDEMESFLNTSELLEKRSLSLLSNYRKINSHISCTKIDQIQIMGVHLGADIIARSVPLEVAQLVIPVSGRLVNDALSPNPQAAESGTAIVHTPNYPVDVKWGSNSSAIVVRIPKNYLQHVFKSYASEEMPQSYRLGSRLDLTRGAGQNLFNIVSHMVRESESDNHFSQDSRQMKLWEELLLTTLLACQGQFSREIIRVRDSCPVYHYVKRATDYIVCNLQDTITLQDLVDVTNVSIRTLQTGFKKTHGVGPMTFIRNKRLEKVNQELIERLPTETTVGDVAAKWGFYHASHFTKIYKSLFSELPSDSLYRRSDLMF